MVDPVVNPRNPTARVGRIKLSFIVDYVKVNSTVKKEEE